MNMTNLMIKLVHDPKNNLLKPCKIGQSAMFRKDNYIMNRNAHK